MDAKVCGFLLITWSLLYNVCLVSWTSEADFPSFLRLIYWPFDFLRPRVLRCTLHHKTQNISGKQKVPFAKNISVEGTLLLSNLRKK